MERPKFIPTLNPLLSPGVFTSDTLLYERLLSITERAREI